MAGHFLFGAAVCAHIAASIVLAHRHLQHDAFGPYTISKNPGLGYMSPEEMATSLGVTLPQFESALRAFLTAEGCPPSALTSDRILNCSYPVFKKFSRTLPSLRGVLKDTFYDTVHASPATSTHAPRFSTVIFLETPDIAESIGVAGTPTRFNPSC